MFCNKCGKEIDANTKFCKYCGAIINNTQQTQAQFQNFNYSTNVKSKKKIYQQWWFWLIIILLSISIVGIGMNGESENVATNANEINSANKNTDKEQITYTKIDIDELEDELENNAAAAKEKYNGKYLEITGRLGTIDSDLKYINLLSVTDEWDLVGVLCAVKDNKQKEVIKTLKKDDTVIVKGKITDVGEVLGYYLDIVEITKKK